MSEPGHSGEQQPRSILREAIREAKNVAADRSDVVVDIREGQKSRLEMLADELQPIFDDVPRDDERFDFAISSGVQPRLWIDSVAHVTLARDRRTYRFLRDTRTGRIVLAESPDTGPIVAQIARYVAERMIERERDLAEAPASLRDRAERPASLNENEGRGEGRGAGFMRALGMILLGGLVGAAITLAIAWERLAELGISF